VPQDTWTLGRGGRADRIGARERPPQGCRVGRAPP